MGSIPEQQVHAVFAQAPAIAQGANSVAARNFVGSTDSMSQTLEQQIQSGIQIVYSKAASDPVFRKLCVSNPKAAIKQALGFDVPAWAKVKMVDPEGANFTFILPQPATASGELKDEDLEHVAGGKSHGTGIVCTPGVNGGPPVPVFSGISSLQTKPSTLVKDPK
jgi:hypothetical protein